MRQGRWLELIKDYELEIHYHPDKENVVADALSKKSQVNMLAAYSMPFELAKEFERLNLGFLNNTQGVTIELEPTLEQDIRKGQKDDEKINEIRQLIIDGKGPDFREDAEGVIWFKDRLCVPDIKSIWELILKEAHETTYSIHPGSKKMYQDLKKRFWWYDMKRETTEYVARCDSCQRIKAEHQRPTGLLQPLQIPQWKWDEIGMDFIVSLLRTRAGYDSIWVVVDRLTKASHFIPVKTTYNSAVLAELYMSQIVCLHGIPKKIISDRGTQFTSHFWQQLHEALGTHLKFSSAYHLQTDGQTERTNQILEDMLRVCALQDQLGWDKRLPYAEFSYNNSYQASLKMSPFEALYGRNCRTPLHWDQLGERQVFGPEILLEAEENIRMVRENLKAAQSRQRSYADTRRRELSFEVGDYVYLKVSPIRGTTRFGVLYRAVSDSSKTWRSGL
jgi:transposase InsO family protein